VSTIPPFRGVIGTQKVSTVIDFTGLSHSLLS
jgi:hypothetical protein